MIMSLRRIGSSLKKGVSIRSDTGELINMLQTPPRRVAALVERGITRWQLRDAARCLPFDPIEAPDIWLRHIALHVVFAERSWSACECQLVFLRCHWRQTMSQSDDDAEPPDRPVVLLLPLCSKVRVLISGTYAQGCFPLPLVVSTHRFLSQARGLPGNLMKPTRPCFGPLSFQARPNFRYSSLVRRRLQIGRRRMTRGWAVIVKGQTAVAGPHYLDGSAFNPETLELRRVRDGACCFRTPQNLRQ